MKKIIILLIIIVSTSTYSFCQYIILPKQGDPIEATKIFKENTLVNYIGSRGEQGNIKIDKILQIMDSNGNEVSINNLKKENDVEVTNTQHPEPEFSKQEVIGNPKATSSKYDLLITKDAQSIKAVILEINDTEIKYKQYENQSGATYSIKRFDMQSIVYSNGEVEVFIGERKKDDVSSANVISENSPYYTVLFELNLLITKSLGNYSWFESKKICEDLSRGGFTDWYLPSKLEFETIIKQAPKIKEEFTKSWHWTSTEINSKEAYNISSNGWATGEKKKENGPDCMCVRKIR